MPFDAVFLHAMSQEINKKALGGKISKIHMPEKNEVVLVMRSLGENLRLLISANANYPRVQLTEVAKENPDAPPMFCMLLRKYLTSGKLIGFTQLSFERVVKLDFENINELGDIEKKSLILEVLGRRSNIILTDGEGRVIDSLFHIDISENQSRQIMSGIRYELPDSQNKYNPFTDFDRIESAILNEDTPILLEKMLISRVMGLSPLLAREIAFKAVGVWDCPVTELPSFSRKKIIKELSAFFDDLKAGQHSPTMLIINGKPKDFTVTGIGQYGTSAECRTYGSYSDLLDAYYRERDEAERKKLRGQELTHLATNTISKLTKKISLQKDELAACADREKFRIFGELVTTNLAIIEKGAPFAELQNYYEDMKTVRIPMDITKSPAQNAQQYFKKYQKLKTAENMIAEQIALAERELQYFESILEAVETAENEADFSEIRGELIAGGYLKNKNKKALNRGRTSKPMHFISSDKTDIYVGKNNIQNDQLTLKTAMKNDIWLHALNIPGSHVIISCGGKAPSDKTLLEAAMLAAFYSKFRMSQKVPITYTEVRHVKKPPGSKPGFVIFTDNKTLFVTPDESRIDAMKADK
ncbi:MAG: NFACT RNA binding domain-containing protein [Bacillota bacterium]|nr:NFACT RNA binding domain-containing protein [Bacillota bacterium]